MALVLVVAACGSDTPIGTDAGTGGEVNGAGSGDNDSGSDAGDSISGVVFLSIVGDSRVGLQNGTSLELSVRYQNESTEPLSGDVEFSIVGDSGGATLSHQTVATSVNGIANVVVTAGAMGEVTFRVRATAPMADPVDWHISVKREVVPVTALGTYELRSTFNLVTGLEALELFTTITGGDSPIVSWLLDLLEEELDGTVQSVLELARGSQVFPNATNLDRFLGGFLERFAPQLLVDLVTISNDLSNIITDFGIVTHLTIAADGSDGGLRSTQRLKGIFFDFDGDTVEYTTTELGFSTPTVSVDLAYVARSRRLELQPHTVTVPYAPLLLKAFESIVVPRLDPTAGSLADLLSGYVDCTGIALFVGYDTGLFFDVPVLGDVSDTVVDIAEQVCEIGIGTAADFALRYVRHLPEGVALTIAGDARGLDTDDDKKVDRLHNGTWTGTIERSGLGQGTLENSRFAGTRL